MPGPRQAVISASFFQVLRHLFLGGMAAPGGLLLLVLLKHTWLQRKQILHLNHLPMTTFEMVRKITGWQPSEGCVEYSLATHPCPPWPH